MLIVSTISIKLIISQNHLLVNLYFQNSKMSENDTYETPKIPNMLNSLSNMFAFGFGLLFFIIGIVYLSMYRYSYSLTTYSVDLIAGFMLAAGVILLLLTTARIFFKKTSTQLCSIVCLSVFLIIFFVLFLILGSIGLSMIDNEQFDYEARNNIIYTARLYDQTNKYRMATNKIDW